MMRLRALVAAALVATGACGGGSSSGARTTLTVLAASSLTEAFDAIVPAFEDAHPGIDVVASFGGSSALAVQIDAGGRGDVFVSADETTMTSLRARRRVADPVVVARNRLAIVVETGNPQAVRGVHDLARRGLVVVLCAPEVPCGRYAARALAQASVDVAPRSLEENVKAVVSRVALGEADAGIVYVTDARAARRETDTVAIEGSDDPALLADYPAAVVRGTDDGDAAAAFVGFLSSPAGQRLFAAAGFLPVGVSSSS